jgi:2-dehydropantoate 2-reductase
VKIAVIGAGSIGGYLGAKLALNGEDVTFLARGSTLEAIRAKGFTLIDEQGEASVAPAKAAEITCGQRFDVVFVGVKAHQVGAIAAQVPALLTTDAPVVTLQNGIPWWYFYKVGGPFEGRRVEAADPDGLASAHIPNERIIGTVVYPASEIVAPGVVRVIEGNRFTLGEPDGSKSERAEKIADALKRAGFKAPVVSDIRSEIWLKLWGNLTFNPLSALTHATLAGICRFPQTRALAVAIMTEAQTVAEQLGVRSRVTIEKRIAGAEAVGEHKTSMLQDIEAGRPIELDAMVGGVIELARLTGVATPALDAVYACTALLAKTANDANARLQFQSN